jgi:hypothetical protein
MAKTKIASETIESENKAFVLEAFDTLFNSVTTRLRSTYGHRTTFSTAHT